MHKKDDRTEVKQETDFLEEIGTKAQRKVKAQKEKGRGIWMGLGLFGVVGWSVIIPTVIGIVFGRWLDKKYTGTVSWTLTFLVSGVVLGCINAWYWVDKERKIIEREKE